MKKTEIDINYIKKWLLEFDKTVEGANFTDSFKQVLDSIKEN